MEEKSKPIFYYFPYSRHNEEAKELLEKSDLEYKIEVIDSREKMAAIATDALMFYGGPNKAPALYIPEENKFYEGLDQIRQYLSSLK